MALRSPAFNLHGPYREASNSNGERASALRLPVGQNPADDTPHM
jgi:hypothetical protein